MKIQEGFPMAIQPIDLQTLYAQLTKVSKTASYQQQGVQLQNAIQQEEEMKRTQTRKSNVQETKMDDEGLMQLKNNPQGESLSQNTDKKESDVEEDVKTKEFEVIRDPELGKHIDISG